MKPIHTILLLIVAILLGCEAHVQPEPLLEFRVAPSSGCEVGSTTSGPFQVEVGGVQRNYRVDVPTGWNGTTPIGVVYSFPACGGDHTNGAWNNLWSRTNNDTFLADDAPGIFEPYNVIVVHTDAAGVCWDIAPSGPDLPYYDAVRTAVEASYCIDGERRYHAGNSSGGFAAQGFACRRDGVAAVFAGIAGIHHASNPYGLTVHGVPAPADCNGPVPVLGMASSTDTLVSTTTYTHPARDAWLAINGCDPGSGGAYTHLVPFADAAAGGAGLGNACTGQTACACTEYDCEGARTVWCEYQGTGGNGHSWPIYYRDIAANWLGRFTAVEDPPGGSSSGGGEGSSSTADPTSSSTTAEECLPPCEMVCQCQ